MFNQERLFEDVNQWYTFLCCGNTEFPVEYWNPYQAYQRCCGKLKLEDLFNIDTVFICANRCASGFGNKKDTQSFMAAPMMNSYNLCNSILNGTFKPTYYPIREIKERGKNRIIKPPTFKCKVVQKVLCDYLIRPLLEPRMTNTNYASVKGKGTSKMYEEINHALNEAIRKYEDFEVITFDYKNYFGSIDTQKIIEKLSELIKDERIINLIKLFSPDDYGLSLGNELSQIPASWYPSAIDHYFKEVFHLQQFRYMDDSLLIVPAEQKQLVIDKYKSISIELGLNCPDEKIKIYHAKENFVFCKEHYVWNKNGNCYQHFINPKIPGKEEHKLHTFIQKKSDGKMTSEAIKQQSNGVIGSIEHHPNTKTTVKRLRKLQEEALL